MSFKSMLFCILIISICLTAGCVEPAISVNKDGDKIDISDQIKNSLVFLNISAAFYDPSQPWKYSDIIQKTAVGCAVGEHEVITLARNLTDAKQIKARMSGQNEFIQATVKVIDHESNLCLLQLDADSMSEPLKPISFIEDYQKGAQLNYYWLSANSNLITGRGILDRAEVRRSTASYTPFLNYIATNTSKQTGIGQVYYKDSKPIAIAAWSNTTQEAGLIPAEIINRFLADVRDGNYGDFSAVGFLTKALLDPAMRGFLKMPAEMKHGVYVSRVYNLGTGSDVLKQGDCLLAIDGQSIDSYGKFLHPQFDGVSFDHLITSHIVGDDITFDIWRDGKPEQLKVKARNIITSEMLVPYYEYDKQPEYIVTAGYVFQKLTRPYLQAWGDNWSGRVPPHLYHYYRDMAFEPTDERRDIVVLSYVFPADINLGYQGLGRMVVSEFNGKQIGSINDILEAQKLNPESKYDVIEFENNYPTIVIPRDKLQQANAMIYKIYGISKPVNIEP